MSNKSLSIILIVILAIIAISLISIMILAITSKNFKVSLFAIGNKTKLIYENEYDVNNIKSIEVDASSSNVKFIEGQEDKVKVSIYGLEDEEFSVNLEQDTLKIIKDKKSFHIFVFMAWARQEVIVEVPKNYNGNIRTQTSSGNIEVFDLEECNVSLDASSGNIRCGNVLNGDIKTTSGNIIAGSGKELNIKATSGNIEAKNADKGIFETSSGNIRLGNVKEVEAKATSGSIKLEKTERVVAKTTSGSIRIDEISKFCDLAVTSGSIRLQKVNLIDNSNIKASSGGVSISEINDIYIDADTTSGQNKINKNNRMSEVELKIRTTSGGIKVN